MGANHICPQIFQIGTDLWEKVKVLASLRSSHLCYGHIFKFSIDALVNMLVRIGRELIITTRPKNRRLESGSLPKLNQTYCECQKLLVQIGSVFFGEVTFLAPIRSCVLIGIPSLEDIQCFSSEVTSFK